MKMLVDGSKLYFASRKVFGRHRLDYTRLAEMSTKERIYFTTFDPSNERQEAFLNVLKTAGFNVNTQYVSGDAVWDFDSALAFMLGQSRERHLVLTNSPFLMPLIENTGSTLCWFSSDLPTLALLKIYRDKTLNFLDLEQT